MKRIAIVNGPNLNLLGSREPDIYGSQSLEMIQASVTGRFSGQSEFAFFQSNSEGELVDCI
ncbi:MAG: type II 3-dehydroquinate dehydratase, partial [Gemmatimonadota bacterium]|nr:type II 3-dehydroquinate dehydratase [Gemmatimonadota bacterium]